jgi:hypothetical protein
MGFGSIHGRFKLGWRAIGESPEIPGHPPGWFRSISSLKSYEVSGFCVLCETITWRTTIPSAAILDPFISNFAIQTAAKRQMLQIKVMTGGGRGTGDHERRSIH